MRRADGRLGASSRLGPTPASQRTATLLSALQAYQLDAPPRARRGPDPPPGGRCAPRPRVGWPALRGGQGLPACRLPRPPAGASGGPEHPARAPLWVCMCRAFRCRAPIGRIRVYVPPVSGIHTPQHAEQHPSGPGAHDGAPRDRPGRWLWGARGAPRHFPPVLPDPPPEAPRSRGPTSGQRGDGRRRASREAPALRPLRRPRTSRTTPARKPAQGRGAPSVSEGTLGRRSRRGTRRGPRGHAWGRVAHVPLCVSSGSGTEAPWCEDAGRTAAVVDSAAGPA